MSKCSLQNFLKFAEKFRGTKLDEDCGLYSEAG